MHDVSIVIPTRNRISDLTLCIESIGRQTELEDVSIELLIVDDGDIEENVLDYLRKVLAQMPSAELRYYRKTKPTSGSPVTKR